MLTIHLHLAPRLRMSRAVRLHALCAFMVWTATFLAFYFHLWLRTRMTLLGPIRCTASWYNGSHYSDRRRPNPLECCVGLPAFYLTMPSVSAIYNIER
jgi:hypothetical protein